MREKPYLRLVPLEEEEEPAEIGVEFPAKDLAVISAALCAAAAAFWWVWRKLTRWRRTNRAGMTRRGAHCAPAGSRGGFEENGRALYTPTKVNAISVGN